MSGGFVLLVDDDDLLRSSLGFSLEQAGFDVHTAGSAEDALAITRIRRPDIILLDVMLPGMSGMEALRKFRDEENIPVIFLTARRRELDQILGLELGADDYLTKPFDPDLVIAHIHAVLRRTKTPPKLNQMSKALTVGGLWIDPMSREATIDGRQLDLTPKEYDLLYALALEAGRVLTIDDLLRRVWGAEYWGEPQIVYVNIRWLRQKIEKDPHQPKLLCTVRGVGYKLTNPSEEG